MFTNKTSKYYDSLKKMKEIYVLKPKILLWHFLKWNN